MFKWLKKKIKDYQNKRRIKKLPVWFRERLSLDRDWENYDLSDRCILSYDFSEQKKRSSCKEVKYMICNNCTNYVCNAYRGTCRKYRFLKFITFGKYDKRG